LIEIKLLLSFYEEVIVRFIQNSQFLDQSPEFLSKIVLKIHQIVMEVSTQFHTGFRNNVVEAHGLYAVVKDLPANPHHRHLEPDFLDFTISVTTGECEIEGESFYINQDIVINN
jgi:hypothetical protein